MIISVLPFKYHSSIEKMKEGKNCSFFPSLCMCEYILCVCRGTDPNLVQLAIVPGTDPNWICTGTNPNRHTVIL